MNSWKLLFRSLAYYRNIHLWVVLGTMISTAILVGALVIGDSVRHSLRQIVFDRLGRTEFALSSEDRLFEARMADDLSNSLGTTVTPLLLTRGVAIAKGGERRINSIQVLGVDARPLLKDPPGYFFSLKKRLHLMSLASFWMAIAARFMGPSWLSSFLTVLNPPR